MPSGMMVGADVGGTWIKLGIVRGSRILLEKAIPTGPIARSPSSLESGLVRAIQGIVREFAGPVAGVGVGIPGLVRYPEGVVLTCANLPGWRNVSLQARLQRRLRLPVRVDNDVNAMTLAEWRYGAGRGARNLLCVTLGTGVGGGLVLNGALYRSRLGPSGEVGHMPVAGPAVGRRCRCGGRACLERYVGNREILRQVQAELKKGVPSRILKLVGGRLDRVTPEVIDRACEQGDRLARRTWRQAGERIGSVLAGVVNLIAPDRIVIGGGIARAGKWLFDPIRRTVSERAMRGFRDIPIVPAHLGASAGMIGAALLVRGKS